MQPDRQPERGSSAGDRRYSQKDQRYTYQSYANSGASHIYQGYALGDNGIVFTEERKVESKLARITTSMIPQSDGRLRLVQERSMIGQPEQTVGEVFYIKRR